MLPGVVNSAVGKEQPQKEQLEEIEKYISQRRRDIENFYIGELTELRLRAEAEIRLLEVADKGVYASLAAQAKIAKTVLRISNYGYFAPWYLEAKTERMLQLKGEHYCDLDTIKKSPKRFAVAQSRIAEAKNDILARFGWGAVDLEKNRRYALDIGLVELEKRLKENVLAPKPEPTHGVVTGILYSKDDPSAVIDGQIVHEGDTIHGAEVVKIHRDKIEFEKSRKKWMQKVQEKPKAFW